MLPGEPQPDLPVGLVGGAAEARGVEAALSGSWGRSAQSISCQRSHVHWVKSFSNDINIFVLFIFFQVRVDDEGALVR